MVALQNPDELPAPLWDGLLTREIKPHSLDKVNYWGRYAQAASVATKEAGGRRKFSGRRACLDLFSSCGVCEIKATGRLTWGSALVALQISYPFDTYIFNDIERANADALAGRAERVGVAGSAVFRIDLGDEDLGQQITEIKSATVSGPRVIVTCGDANEAVVPVKMLVPSFQGYRYILALIDPTSLDFRWKALEMLAFEEKHLDIIEFFPDMELNRWINLYRDSEDLGTKVDDFIGTREWRAAVENNPAHPAQAMHELYEHRMKELVGLRPGDPKVIRGRDTHADLYRLIFASKNQFGVDLWHKVNRRTPWGQDELPLFDL